MIDPRIPSQERQQELRDLSVARVRPYGPTVFQEELVEAIAWADAEHERATSALEDIPYCDVYGCTGTGLRTPVEACRDCLSAQRHRADAAEASLDAAGRTLGAVIMAALPLAPGEERVPGLEDGHAAVQAVLRVVRERDEANAERAALHDLCLHYQTGPWYEQEARAVKKARVDAFASVTAEWSERNASKNCRDDIRVMGFLDWLDSRVAELAKEGT